MNKDNININLNGKEYLEVLKYRNRSIFTKKQLKFYSVVAMILIIGLIAIAGIIEVFSTPAEPIVFSWNGILMFLTICAGLGWVFHGTGFLLVRVK